MSIAILAQYLMAQGYLVVFVFTSDGGLNNIKDCCRPYTRLSNDNGPRTGEPCVYKESKVEVDCLKVYIGPAVVSLPLNNRRLYCLKQYQDDDAEVDAERLGRKINICLQIFWLKLLCSDNFCSKQPDQSCKCCHCLLYTSPSPRDRTRSRMPSSA